MSSGPHPPVLLDGSPARFRLAVEHAPAQALADDDIDDAERAFAGQLGDFVAVQATRLTRLAGEAAKIKPEFL